MGRRICRPAIASVITLAMLFAAGPFFAVGTAFAVDDPLVGFTDENDRGQWAKTSGNGSIEFTDGADDAGYMTISSDGNTIFADEGTTDRADGYVEMDMTMTSASQGARMAVIFHYNSPTDWDGIGVDGGGWTYFTGSDQWGSVASSKSTFTTVGEKHHLRVEYRGQEVRVIEDGTEIINTRFPLIPVKLVMSVSACGALCKALSMAAAHSTSTMSKPATWSKRQQFPPTPSL